MNIKDFNAQKAHVVMVSIMKGISEQMNVLVGLTQTDDPELDPELDAEVEDVKIMNHRNQMVTKDGIVFLNCLFITDKENLDDLNAQLNDICGDESVDMN